MERTAVTSAADPRFLAGLACLLLWGGLLWTLWRRRRRVEALGVAWIGIALAPVSNLVFPVGVLVAERTLYLPSVGLALAVGAGLAAWRATVGLTARRSADAAVALVVVAGGARAALRVPVWESTEAVYQSVVRDSPRSYFGAAIAARYAETEGRFDDALEAYRRAARLLPADNRLSLHAAEVAFRLGRAALVDSLIAHVDSTCVNCVTFYEAAAMEARWRGRTAWSDWLARHLAARIAEHRS
jgi:tetratricopeptide (TPR) repeat protein